MMKFKDITVRPIARKIEKRPGCVQAASEILGDKWSAMLVGHLFEEPKTFGELDTVLPGISPRTLSARINELESSKIIQKKLYCKHPPRHKYSLTKKGQDLRAILVQMASWGEKYN